MRRCNYSMTEIPCNNNEKINFDYITSLLFSFFLKKENRANFHDVCTREYGVYVYRFTDDLSGNDHRMSRSTHSRVHVPPPSGQYAIIILHQNIIELINFRCFCFSSVRLFISIYPSRLCLTLLNLFFFFKKKKKYQNTKIKKRNEMNEANGRARKSERASARKKSAARAVLYVSTDYIAALCEVIRAHINLLFFFRWCCCCCVAALLLMRLMRFVPFFG